MRSSVIWTITPRTFWSSGRAGFRPRSGCSSEVSRARWSTTHRARCSWSARRLHDPLRDDHAGRRGQLVGRLAKRFLRVLEMGLRRVDRDDLGAYLGSYGMAHRLPERAAHAGGDTVRSGPGRHLVLPENLVRESPHLEMELVGGGPLEDPHGTDTGRLEGDVADLTGLFHPEG